MTRFQKTGKIRLPKGKKVALAICCDFDGQTIWLGANGEVSQSAASRGEHDAMVCMPRILKVLKKYDIKTTFFVPGHTADTFPDECREIINAGHEIGHHGYNNQDLSNMSFEEEEEALKKGFEALAKLGVRPVGYRSPTCEFSNNTLTLLEKYGFKYDNSLMGNDIYPYYPRPVEVNFDRANLFGPPSSVLALPTSLHMDDFPYMDNIMKDPTIPHFDCYPTSELYDRCVSIYKYASRFEGTMLTLTIHTQATGNRSRIEFFERLIEYYLSHDAWITTCENIADAVVIDTFLE